MVAIATLQSQHGARTSIEFHDRNLQTLAHLGKVDAFIVSTEDGFSPLGQNRRFLSADLAIPEEQIRELADWNRFKNTNVSLVALPSRNPESRLRGIILAPSENSESYKRFATPRYGHPYRDFYYNVSYEAIAYASGNWQARRLTISHLSGCGNFKEDIAICNAEALAHFCDANNANIDSFVFAGCCISVEHLTGISRLNPEGKTGRHVPIEITVEHHPGYELVHLDWNRDGPNGRS